MHVRVRKGLNIPIAGEPEQRIYDANPVGWVALVARDFEGLRPRLLAEVGGRVVLGQPLLVELAAIGERRGIPVVLTSRAPFGRIIPISRGDSGANISLGKPSI